MFVLFERLLTVGTSSSTVFAFEDRITAGQDLISDIRKGKQQYRV